MNDEIKEILDGMKKANNKNCNLWLENVSVKLLYNYITNLQEENERLKFWLNDVIFDDNNNDVELPARYLRKLGYIDFDDEKQVYTNKHNNETFWQKEYKEKVFSLKDDELDDYTKQLEYKFKKAIEFIKEENGYYDGETRSCTCDLLYSDCDKLIELLGGDEE